MLRCVSTAGLYQIVALVSLYTITFRSFFISVSLLEKVFVALIYG